MADYESRPVWFAMILRCPLEDKNKALTDAKASRLNECLKLIVTAIKQVLVLKLPISKEKYALCRTLRGDISTSRMDKYKRWPA